MTIILSGLTTLALIAVVWVAVNRRPMPTPDGIDEDDLTAIVNAVIDASRPDAQALADFAVWRSEYVERDAA